MDILIPKMTYCTKCVYAAIQPTPLTFDEKGACSGCRTYEEQKTVNWTEKRLELDELINDYRSKDNYDVVIGVSGGKDSFYQAHVLTKEYGLKALFVCYRENNHTDVGMRNIQRMKECFKGDFLEFTPEVELLKKFNRYGMLKCGDPNLHTHFGIMTLVISMANKYNVPLFVYGEHGFMNLGGMHSYKDMVEFTKKYRTEHMQRGYDWPDIVGFEGITEKDLLWCKYPSDEDITSKGLRGIFLSNYLGWQQDTHTALMKHLYGFESWPGPRERTFLRDSNLNDIHDDGIHDWMKYIKFGVGRATDHACRQIRQGIITRDQGIEYVKAYDHVEPSDIPRWLEYVNWDRIKLYDIANTYRNPRVWVKNEYGHWVKDNIWSK